MPKTGDEYQQIVGAVVKALDPGAQVTVGKWVIGPDGRRDKDVEVRGTKSLFRKASYCVAACKRVFDVSHWRLTIYTNPMWSASPFRNRL
jgi:hypothetical protein